MSRSAGRAWRTPRGARTSQRRASPRAWTRGFSRLPCLPQESSPSASSCWVATRAARTKIAGLACAPGQITAPGRWDRARWLRTRFGSRALLGVPVGGDLLLLGLGELAWDLALGR